MSDTPKHPQEKYGYNLMVVGFVFVLLAGAAYFLAPRTEPVYGRVGNYLMGIGFAIYLAGRIIKGQGKRRREKGEIA